MTKVGVSFVWEKVAAVEATQEEQVDQQVERNQDSASWGRNMHGRKSRAKGGGRTRKSSWGGG